MPCFALCGSQELFYDEPAEAVPNQDQLALLKFSLCQRIGLSAIGIIGLGMLSEYSWMRVPRPPRFHLSGPFSIWLRLNAKP
jgi:hypothetical protein